MQIFKTGFGVRTFDGDTIEATFNGFRFVATVYLDLDTGPPWKEHHGPGPVRDWTSRDKRPGELVLCTDRGSRRFYDFAEACRIARRDGWDVVGPNPAKTRRSEAALAARHDFEILRAWCNDEWQWCGIGVDVYDSQEEIVSEFEYSLWGIDMNYPGSQNSYLLDVANDLADEAWRDKIEPLLQAQATVHALEAVGV